jgi:hypothetical protein
MGHENSLNNDSFYPTVQVQAIVKNQALSENSFLGPRASGFSPGKDGEAGDVGFIVDTRVQSGGEQAARSQIEFADRA